MIDYSKAFPPPKKVNIREQLKLFRKVFVVIFFMMIVIAVFLIVGKMNDEVSGKGQVAGIREYELKSQVAGRSVEIVRHEGDYVKKGDVLMRLDVKPVEDRIEKLQNELKALKILLSAKTKEFDILKKDPLPDYYRHTRLQLTEAQEKFARSEKELQTYRSLYAKKAISLKELLKVETENFSLKMTLERMKADWDKIQDGTLAAEILAKSRDEIALIRQNIANKEADLQMEERNREYYVFRAPDNGILTEIPPRPGNYYAPGDIVAKMAVDQNIKVVALVNEKQIHKIQKGQLARIISNQYNYLDFGYFYGEVEVVYQLPVEIDKQFYYPVKIVLTHMPYPLRFGSSCNVSIVTGRERIIFALLDLKSDDYLKRRSKALKSHEFEERQIDEMELKGAFHREPEDKRKYVPPQLDSSHGRKMGK